jgi:hypothetical protein
MKHNFFILAFVLLPLMVLGQENWITVNGGYAFGKVEDTEGKLTGYRISLSYEKNAYEGKMVHGMVVGYIATEGSAIGSLNQTFNYKLSSIPIYYMPKYILGSGNFKGFLKGAVGLHISDIEKTGIVIVEQGDAVGFYLGLGAGAMYTIKKIFISVEYEWAFAANSFYHNGFINSATLGLGIKF